MPAVVFGTTPRLNLRAYRESDRDRLLELWNDPRVTGTYQVDYVVPHGPKFAKEWEDKLQTALVHLVIEVKPGAVDSGGGKEEGKGDGDVDVFVGECNMFMRTRKNRDADFGIALLPRWWGRGFATEVTRWADDYAFHQLAVHRVSLGVMGCNAAALHLYKKIGFVEEGRRRRAFWQDGEWVDDVLLGMMEEEWMALRKT